MKKLRICATPLLIMAAALGLQAQEKEITLTASNTWKEAKQNEPIVLAIDDLKPGFTVQSVVVKEGNTEIPSQLDDLNGDSQADEVAFLLDMPAKSKRNITVTLSAEKSNKTYPAQVYAQMMLSDKKKKYPKIQSLTVPGESDVYNCLHHHGPAFESELVAYRIYFDKRQTVDTYGKSRKGLEIAETLFYPTDEHKAKGYGDDVLWVGSTCGGGTLKGWEDGKPAHIIPALRTECIRAYGPLRTVVDIIDTDWSYQGKTITMTTRYILYGGHRDVRVEVSFKEPLADETFCAGVINVKDSENYSDHKGLIGCWGTDWPAGANDTVGRKLETVGLAVCIPNQYVKEEQTITDNLIYTVGAKGEKCFTYHLSFASLRESFGFKNAKEWFGYMKQWKKELEHPCKVEINGKL